MAGVVSDAHHVMVGADAEDWGDYLHVPLLRAMKNQNLQAFVRLLDVGASVGHEILHFTVLDGLEEFCRVLLDRGADIDEHGDWNFNGDTPLMTAAPLSDGVGKVEILMAAGAKLDGRNKDQMSALDIAVEFDNVPMVRLIAERITNINTQDAEGWTALHYVESVDVVDILVSAGASVDSTSNDGHTPLHHVSGRGLVDTVSALLRHGAKYDAASKNGNTPLHEACNAPKNGVYDVVSVLLYAGANEQQKNEDGSMPDMLLDERDAFSRKAGATTEEIDRTRLLLKRAKVWRRRGWLVLLRARVLQESEKDGERKKGRGRGVEVGLGVEVQWLCVASGDVFRSVVGFL